MNTWDTPNQRTGGLTWRDGAATALVAAIVIPYAGYLTRGSVPFVHEVRAMSAAGLMLGLLACGLGARDTLGTSPVMRVARTVGGVSLVLGLLALITANGSVLAAFMSTIVFLWTLATLRHAGMLPADAVNGRNLRS